MSDAIERAPLLGETELPPMRASSSDAIPPIRLWRERAKLAHAHLTHARFNLTQIAEGKRIPLENLISPEIVRRIAWQSERQAFSEPLLRARMEELGARPWQIELTAKALYAALQESEPLIEESSSESEEDSASPE